MENDAAYEKTTGRWTRRSGSSASSTQVWRAKVGRRKLSVVDWNADGRLICWSTTNVNGLEICARQGVTMFRDRLHRLKKRSPVTTTSPRPSTRNEDGVPDLLVGLEDGHFYYTRRGGAKMRSPP